MSVNNVIKSIPKTFPSYLIEYPYYSICRVYIEDIIVYLDHSSVLGEIYVNIYNPHLTHLHKGKELFNYLIASSVLLPVKVTFSEEISEYLQQEGIIHG